MARFYKKRLESQDQEAGSLIYIGLPRQEKVRLQLFVYDKDHCEEYVLEEPEDACKFLAEGKSIWLNVEGVHDAEIIKRVGTAFDLHPLILEDVMNTGQRARFEEFDGQLFATLKMLQYDDKIMKVIPEQVSIVVCSNITVSFQEVIERGDVFDAVRERLRKNKGRLRSEHPLFLAYGLIDLVVDHYIFIVERIGERIEDLELKVLRDSNYALIEEINSYKREMNFLSKLIRPAKEMVFNIIKSDTGIISKRLTPFVKDLFDNITHVIESIDTYRDLLSDYLNIFHTQLNYRLNEVIRVLTIFSAVFIPLTFLVGVYGMNFVYFPELKMKYGYFVIWGVMIGMAGGMLYFFKHKKWL